MAVLNMTDLLWTDFSLFLLGRNYLLLFTTILALTQWSQQNICWLPNGNKFVSVFPLAFCILYKFQVEVSSGRANQQCLFLHLWIYRHSSFTGMLHNFVYSVATQSHNKLNFVFPRLSREQNPVLHSAVLKLLSDSMDGGGYPCHTFQTHFKRSEWVLCLFPRRGSRCLNPEFGYEPIAAFQPELQLDT